MDNIERFRPISISLPESVITEIDRMAAEEFRPRSNVIGRILMQEMARRQSRQEQETQA